MSSQAAELLRALNSQVTHEPPPLLSVLEDPSPPLETSSGLTSILLEPKALQPGFQSRMRFDEGNEAPECLTQLLVGLMSANEKLFENVQSLLRQREKNAYDSFTGTDNGFVRVMLEQAQRQQNPYLDVVAGMMAKRQDRIEGDLQQGKLYVHVERNLSNRRQIERLQKLDLARMIQIKDGELRSKMDVLHKKLEDFQQLSMGDVGSSEQEADMQRRVMENIDAQTYSLHSQRTKIAQDYVRHLNKQRRSLELKRKQREALQQQEQSQMMKKANEAQLMRELAKRQEILKRIDDQRKQREQQEKEIEAKSELARKLVAEHHRKMPIFKLKEKQFQEKILKPAQRYREEKLNEIRAYRRAMSLQEIKQHEEKYLGKLEVSQSKREEEFKMILKSRHPEKHRYYKGKAHARMQEMTKEDVLRSLSMREASKLKLDRMREYNKVVHKLHPPSVDQEKRKELIKSIQADLLRNKHVRKVFKQVQDEQTQEIKFQEYYQEIPQKDWRQEGNRLFMEAKKHIKKKPKETAAEQIEQLEKQEGKEKEKEETKTPLKVLSPAGQQKKSRNVWQIRGKQLQQFANCEVKDALKFQYVKHNIQNLDNKAAQKQELMRHIQVPMQEQLKQKSMLEDFYLQSIKQKMKLLD